MSERTPDDRLHDTLVTLLQSQSRSPQELRRVFARALHLAADKGFEAAVTGLENEVAAQRPNND